MGEGGGQVLRLAAIFSVIKRVPVRVTNIRAGRDSPGLKRQHVSTLKVLAEVFGASLAGATEGSSEVTFAPGSAKLRHFSIDMGTAASITLVLQAVVPAAALSGGELSLELVGGTDVPWSPTFDYFDSVVRRALGSIGINFDVHADRRGYYPRGGGRVRASIQKCDAVAPLDTTGRSGAPDVVVVSRCGALPKHVAERQLASAVSFLTEAGLYPQVCEAREEAASSPGSSVLASCVGQDAFLGGDAIGERGRPAEDVGRSAAERLVMDVRSGAPYDANVADMVIPLLSLAPGPSRVKVPRVTSHLETGLKLAAQFTSCRYQAERSGEGWIVSTDPVLE